MVKFVTELKKEPINKQMLLQKVVVCFTAQLADWMIQRINDGWKTEWRVLLSERTMAGWRIEVEKYVRWWIFELG